MSYVSENTVTTIDVTDPLYCNPNDVVSTLKITPILTEVEKYIPWKRGMQLALSSKRKLGFVTGAVEKSKRDNVIIEAWLAANSLVISWILQNVSEPIKMAILYTQSAKEIWKLLKGKYLVSNGARKYKLNKDSYECNPNRKPVTDYYIQLRTEICAFLDAMQKHKEDARLFQFLNGLDKTFGIEECNTAYVTPAKCG
ncbi:uncharacterized protein LOC141629214 [Silene latifolia]|uniref:uncharacterized protein LOC141629214 n=1 Tax=Silene latifolia TaxID=37657 RepID=UPI003D778FBA